MKQSWFDENFDFLAGIVVGAGITLLIMRIVTLLTKMEVL